MTQGLSRRSVLAGAGASAAVLTTLGKPEEAEAGLISIFAMLLMTGDIITAGANLLEYGISAAFDSNRQAVQDNSMAQMGQKISTIANNQRQILDGLANQRIVMREELKRAFLDNDNSSLLAINEHFNALVAGGASAGSSELTNLAYRAGEIATKMSTYGVPGVSAYLIAIALTNNIHEKAGSPAGVFITMNQAHRQHLNDILYGNGPSALPTMETQVGNTLVGVDSENDPRAWFGKQYPILRARAYYVGSDGHQHVGVLLRGLQYNGYQGTTPLLSRYTNLYTMVRNTQVDIPYGEIFRSSGESITARIEALPYDRTDFINTERYVDMTSLDNRTGVQSFVGSVNSDLQFTTNAEQVAEFSRIAGLIQDHYKQLYEPGQVYNFNAQTPHTKAAAIGYTRKVLVTGIQAIDKMIATKQRQNTARPTASYGSTYQSSYKPQY